MTTKLQYEAVVTSANNTRLSVVSLDNSLSETDLSFSTDIDVIEFKLNAIIDAANAKLLEIEQEQVMNSFLAEMKVVFDKYTAKIEIGSDETGYGEAYGAGEVAVGIKLTATLDGVTSTKEIDKSVITGADLV